MIVSLPIGGSSSMLEGEMNMNTKVQQSWSSHRGKRTRCRRESAEVKRDVERSQPLKIQVLVG